MGAGGRGRKRKGVKKASTRHSLHVTAPVKLDKTVSVSQHAAVSSSSTRILSPYIERIATMPCHNGMKPRASGVVVPHVEVLRLNAITRLRAHLDGQCQSLVKSSAPIYTFDRWLARALRHQSQSGIVMDPIIPSITSYIDEGIGQDLSRIGLDIDDCRRISMSLSRLSADLAATIQGTALPLPTPIVQLHRHRHTISLSISSFPKLLIKINTKHYEKLFALHSRHSAYEDHIFHDRLYALLVRYQSIGAEGFQAALGPDVFKELKASLDVTLECFASPLNAHFATFGSIFADTDSHFGSLGDFFSWSTVFESGGSFEVNPPFIPMIMLMAVERCVSLLDACSYPMSFIVIVPAWLDDAAWIVLMETTFNVAHWVISKAQHGFCDGAQHKRQDLYRQSPFDTGVFILQNIAGQTKWSNARVGLERRFRHAMTSTVPTAAAQLRRSKARRGNADPDRAMPTGNIL